ncbi:MAG TPA: HEAT repeat domain-containing protein [Elusimicrobiota bacterium]|nr:HEAT repeat domain-containing protein [Elusimicrobiota bacterium]
MAASAAALLAAACVNAPVVPTPGAAADAAAASAASSRIDPQILTAMQNLIDNDGNYTPTITPQNSVPGTPEGDLLNLGSPAGYSLRNHYLNIGVPLAEAFAANTDPDFAKQLVTLARWSSNTETRADALMIVAQRHDPADLPIFQEALNFIDPGVRFAAIEALALWQNPDQAVPLLTQEATSDSQAVLRVTAAGMLARLGDASGLPRLRDFLSDGSWVVRAMATRFLGDYGAADDYDLLVNRISQDQGNDFLVAEDCVAALKLFPKKNP